MGGEENLSNNRCINPLKKIGWVSFLLLLGQARSNQKIQKAHFIHQHINKNCEAQTPEP
jgi:predicted glycosyltransferase involved in capsule biosynthesis